MNWQLDSLASRPAQGWRNGGGITRELLAWLLRCAGNEVQVPPYHLAWRPALAPLQAEVHAQDALWMETLA